MMKMESLPPIQDLTITSHRLLGFPPLSHLRVTKDGPEAKTFLSEFQVLKLLSWCYM